MDITIFSDNGMPRILEGALEKKKPSYANRQAYLPAHGVAFGTEVLGFGFSFPKLKKVASKNESRLAFVFSVTKISKFPFLLSPVTACYPLPVTGPWVWELCVPLEFLIF